ncbi:hypothetical protein GUJ93_ZPchr0012g19596 [Zizania palustris]|uniref:Uncharacterized protein n=1 Tax=Zizania palustris TaxID=103762 RepID=A0A8J6BTE5_ZIZPA|nr:hypothetical protein GUJ93_ZPchr0012g19596 [Zizania palustris]
MEVPEAMVLEILATDEESPVARLPPRIRRRLLRAGGGAPAVAEEIEAKFSEAHLRSEVRSNIFAPLDYVILFERINHLMLCMSRSTRPSKKLQNKTDHGSGTKRILMSSSTAMNVVDAKAPSIVSKLLGISKVQVLNGSNKDYDFISEDIILKVEDILLSCQEIKSLNKDDKKMTRKPDIIFMIGVPLGIA